MKIDNIFNTYKACQETQKMRNRSDLSKRHLADNRDLAIQMLKEDKTIAMIMKKTGIGRDAISSYKKQLRKAA